MLYTAKRGQEHKLIVSENIHDENEFMYPAYYQAKNALREIVTHAKMFDRNDICRELYGYSQNIIAFSGERGQGKTSTMVSFSKAMSNHDLRDSIFTGCAFEVLPPIDPTIMEETQSILGVILSRMYRMAEESWGKNCGSKGFSLCGPTEAQKNDLLQQFQRCLNGINSVKYRKGAEIKSLIEINEMGDSSLLKQNLYKLTHMLLEFIAPNVKEKHRFLVIQLDDTDSQIHTGYEILEDIRKFFSIPNVVILMATDINLLRKVILQHQIEAFEPSLRRGVIEIEKLQKIESKYIDKLIPPTHMVHLPKLDNCVVQHGERMTVRYEDEKGVNVLLEVIPQVTDADISTQALILRYIYRKTGIVFAAPTNYFHNIIPTTLRGLAQMLRLLSFMKDVPEPKTDANISAAELKKHVAERVEILEVNLPLFENYFLNEWLEAKLPEDFAKIIREVAGTVPSERIHRIIKLLSNTYQEQPKAANMTYSDFVSYMYELEKRHRTVRDFYLFFSIRTCLNILYHKAALRQMRIAIERNETGPIIFDFSPMTCYLPDTFYLPDQINVSDDCEVFSALKPTQCNYDETMKFVMRLLYREYLPCNEKEQAQLAPEKTTLEKFNFMHFITMALSLGRAPSLRLVNSETSQSWLYRIQMAALTVAANWDVQNKITKRFRRLDPKINGRYLHVLTALFAEADGAIEEINKGSSNVPPMLQGGLRNILDCVNPAREKAYQADIAACFGDIERLLGPADEECINSLRNIYAAAKKIKHELEIQDKNPEIMHQLDLSAYILLDLCIDFNTNYMEIFGENAAFDLRKIEVNYAVNPVSGNTFWRNFKTQFKKVCLACKINEEVAKKA